MRMNILSFLVHAAQYQNCDMRIPSMIKLMTYLVISLEYATLTKVEVLTP
jgi:hypothetical protein